MRADMESAPANRKAEVQGPQICGPQPCGKKPSAFHARAGYARPLHLCHISKIGAIIIYYVHPR